jgi:hydrogenase/urease accessory protein HupE
MASLTITLARVGSFLLVLTCFINTALAHDPGLSSAALRVNGKTINAHLTFSRIDVERLVWLDLDRDGKVSPQEFQSTRAQLEALGPNVLKLAMNAEALSLRTCAIQLDPGDGVAFDLSYLARCTHLSVSSELISSLARGHRQYLTVRDEQNRTIGEQMLDAANHRVELEVAEPVRSEAVPAFCRFLILGIEHITTGYDHLLFLFGLLLVGAAFHSALKIVTAFTLAHSLTLALATFNVISLSAAVVEPLIAASIIYVGIENILSRTWDKRWLLAFGFGLIHGCGFASALKEAGVGRDGAGVALPLFSFNLGVELGQIGIAALVLPLIWKLRQTPNFTYRYAPVCSTVIALAGSYWLIERVVLR